MVSRERLRDGIADSRRSGALVLWLVFTSAVGAAVVAYVGHSAGVRPLADDRWDADMDRSVVEVLGYGFLVIAVGLLLGLLVARGAPVYGAWAGALTLLVMDDALGLHERAGAWVERNLDVVDPPGLRIVDVGELGFWAVTGAFVSVGLYLAHRHSGRAAQAHSLRLSLLIGLLMVFAVALDMLHIAVKSITDNRPLDVALIATEAAGEAAAMAALAAYALHLVRQPAGRTGPQRPVALRAAVPPLLRGVTSAASPRLQTTSSRAGAPRATEGS